MFVLQTTRDFQSYVWISTYYTSRCWWFMTLWRKVLYHTLYQTGKLLWDFSIIIGGVLSFLQFWNHILKIYICSLYLVASDVVYLFWILNNQDKIHITEKINLFVFDSLQIIHAYRSRTGFMENLVEKQNFFKLRQCNIF